jgi:hypothetical protein
MPLVVFLHRYWCFMLSSIVCKATDAFTTFTLIYTYLTLSCHVTRSRACVCRVVTIFIHRVIGLWYCCRILWLLHVRTIREPQPKPGQKYHHQFFLYYYFLLNYSITIIVISIVYVYYIIHIFILVILRS